MRIKILLIVVLMAFGCQDDSLDGSTEGCWTGIYKGTSKRTYITCCDYDTYKDGAVGDNSAAADYSSWKFEKMDCQTCRQKYWGTNN